MSIEGQKFYPGDEATAEQILALAEIYHEATIKLRSQCKRGKLLTRAPFGLAAIHAIELYLNAFLMSKGVHSAQLRGMHHDLERRRTLALAKGLRLPKNRREHIDAISRDREYLVMRYGPETEGKHSQLNQLESTLKVLRDKVEGQIRSQKV